MRKQRILAILLFILYLCAVAYCCFGRFKDLPQIGQDSLWGIPMDKVVHFIIFFPFPILCYAAFRPKSEKGWRIALAVAIIFVIGCAVAAGTEIFHHLQKRGSDGFSGGFHRTRQHVGDHVAGRIADIQEQTIV